MSDRWTQALESIEDIDLDVLQQRRRCRPQADRKQQHGGRDQERGGAVEAVITGGARTAAPPALGKPLRHETRG